MADLYIKIHRGTGKLTEEHLCRTCSYSRLMTDYRGESTYCSIAPRIPINGKVIDCNAYYNATLPSLAKMEESAWTLRTEKDGRAIGFAPPDPDDKSHRTPTTRR